MNIDQVWRPIYELAAELSVVHRTDANQIQKAISYILTKRPDHVQLRQWLDARIDYAELFPRSLVTRDHDIAVRELINFVSEIPTVQSTTDIVEVLGWITRLMSYFRGNRNEAQRRMSQRGPHLRMPNLPPVQLKKRTAPRPSQLETIPEPPADGEVGAAASEFIDFLNKKKG